MAEQDVLGGFDWGKVTKPSVFLKFEVDKPLTLRVLTVDPIVFNSEFEDKKTGEVNVTTKFAFIVYNFTEEKAQILQATPLVAKKISEIHADPDFGENIRDVDIKISPTTGSNGFRQYDVQVLPKARTLTNEQIEEAKAIDLDAKIEGDRMSFYNKADVATRNSVEPAVPDVVVDDVGDQPINLDDIPF